MQVDKALYERLQHAAEAYLSAHLSNTDKTHPEFEVVYQGTSSPIHSTISRQAFVDALRYFHTMDSSRPGGPTLTESRTTEVVVNIGGESANVNANPSSPATSSYRVTFPASTSTYTHTDSGHILEVLVRQEEQGKLQGLPMMQKHRIHPAVDISEYALRLNVKSETTVDASATGIRSIVAKALLSPSSAKTVREKSRFSMLSKDGRFRYDFTSVRQYQIRELSQAGRARAEVAELYEIEIEHVMQRSSPNTKTNEENVAKGGGGGAVGKKKGRGKASSAAQEDITAHADAPVKKKKASGKESKEEKSISGHVDTESAKDIVIGILGASSVLLKVVEEVDYLLPRSAKDNVIREYASLVGGDAFIGPKPVTLKKHNVVSPAVPGKVSVLTGYTVTEKADGERRLLFVAGDGKVYTLDDRGSRMGVAYTGLTSKGPRNTILDGEFVPVRAMEAFDHPLYMCFDAYFLDGSDLRALPLMQDDVPDRLSACKRVIDAGMVPTRPGKDCEVRVKQFYPVNSANELFARATTLFRERDAGMFPYDIDGLIFTPADLPVMASSASDPPRRRGGMWEQVLKWKPPHMNTIDFLVKFHRNDIVTKQGDGSLPDAYRVADLFVGQKASERQPPLTPLDFVTGAAVRVQPRNSGKGFNASSSSFQQHPSEYIPVLFEPKTPASSPSSSSMATATGMRSDADGTTSCPVYQALLKMNERGAVVLDDGSEITNNVVAEFAYDPRAPDPCLGWIPLRMRHDKTQKVYESRTAAAAAAAANNFHVAQDVWDSIHDPITEGMLKTGKGLVFDIAGKKNRKDDQVDEQQEREQSEQEEGAFGMSQYYVRASNPRREEHGTFPMRQFHNGWVKSRTLLIPFSGNVASIFDVGSGKGGDIPKWLSMSGLQRVLGVDLYRDGIVDPVDGAYARLQQHVAKHHHNNRQKHDFPRILFLPLDASKKIDEAQLNAMQDEGDRLVARVLWGLEPVDRIKDVRLKELHGFAKAPFDLVSSQFAVHYFFERADTLRAFASNVAAALRPGGYFVGTCLDGTWLNAKLAPLEKGGHIQGDSPDGKLMWHVRKMYDGSLEDVHVDERVGYKVAVYMESIGQVIPEFLVDYKLLAKTLDDFGIVPLSSEHQKLLGLNASTGGFGELFDSMQEYAAGERQVDRRVADALHMTEAHKEYSFLNRWFVFQKKNR